MQSHADRLMSCSAGHQDLNTWLHSSLNDLGGSLVANNFTDLERREAWAKLSSRGAGAEWDLNCHALMIMHTRALLTFQPTELTKLSYNSSYSYDNVIA